MEIAKNFASRVLGKVFFILFSISLSGCSTLEVTENMFLRPDQRPPAPETLGNGYVMENVSVLHSDGIASRGVYFHKPQSIATILYFGGNEFRIDREAKPVVERLAKADVDVMIFDYRGYGRTDGAPTSALLRSDANDVFRFATSTAGNPVVVYGLSLGSFVAASIAEGQLISGLVLEAAATNADEWVKTRVPWYATPFVEMKIAPEVQVIDNVSSLQKYEGPLLLLAGEQDDVVPVAMQRALYQQAKSSVKELKVFSSYGHKGLIASEEFPQVLQAFLIHQVGLNGNARAGSVSGAGLVGRPK